VKLRKNLLNIADSSMKLPEDEARDIASLLGDHFEDEDLRNEFFDLFMQLMIEQPFKIPFLGAIVFYANDNKPEISQEALKRVSARTQEALNGGQWKEFKLLLRFFACIQAIFEGDGVFAILQQLFDNAADLQSADENDVVGIELVKIILLTLPYALVAGGASLHNKAAELLEKTGIVALNTLSFESLIEPYVGDTDEKPIPYLSIISLLQKQLQREAASGWKFACIPRFSKPVRHAAEENGTILDSPKHPFPAIEFPSPINPGPRQLFPEAYFSIYADQEVESAPPTTDIAASLIRDVIVDTTDQLHFNRIAAAKYLIDLDCYWQTDTFVKRGTSFDKLDSIEEGKSTWKTEDIIVDAIFSQLFKLPHPEHKLIYYHSLITESCRAAPAAIAPSLGRAIRFLFKNMDVMDLELAHRFLDWFAHHLSNFEFRWKWSEWSDDLARSDLHPKKAFIRAAVDKEVRLSFPRRVRGTLPAEYHFLVPGRLDAGERPDFKYESDQTPFAAEGRTMYSQIRKKASDEEIQETFDAIHAKAKELGMTEVQVPSTDAFVTSLCCAGSKSLSHVVAMIERTKARLFAISQSSEAARRQIILSVIDYWKDHRGVALYILDKLLNYSILTPMTTIQWALTDNLGAGEGLTENWVFEMVSNTVGKMMRSLDRLFNLKTTADLNPEFRVSVDEAFARERDSLRELLQYIERALKPVADGIADTYLEKTGSGELSEKDAALIREWGKRWHTVFARKAVLEEMVIGDAAVEAKLRVSVSQAAPQAEIAQAEIAAVDGNGAMDVDANGDA
jgi:nuclear cap-binding protein subunit 1